MHHSQFLLNLHKLKKIILTSIKYYQIKKVIISHEPDHSIYLICLEFASDIYTVNIFAYALVLFLNRLYNHMEYIIARYVTVFKIKIAKVIYIYNYLNNICFQSINLHANTICLIIQYSKFKKCHVYG